MTGYSLHVGLNRVDPTCYDGWDGALSGCVNDANSMRQLASAEGFQTTILLDDQATSQAVIGELSLLAQQAVAGDLLLITYSGHGGQVDDANGDEPDLRDETWVLYERQVVDDELWQMWSQFRPGVRIVVVSDSCHSGSVARARTAVEYRSSYMQPGGARDVAPPASRPRNMPYAVQQTDNQRRRGTYQFVQALSGAKSDQEVAAAVILLSGCQDNQLSFDGAVNGQFTGALLQTWASGAFQGDYRAFHSAILATMPPDQTPNLFTVGQVSPAFLGQRPFTINAASGLPSTSSGRPVLRQGATGGDVVYLQNRLIAHGHSVTPDGVFGPGTAAAVRAFQSARGLPADGVVGPMTWGQLDAAPMSTGGGMPVGGGTTSGSGTSSGGGTPGGGTSVGGNGSGSVTVVARPILRRGMTGEHVTYLQVRLADHGYSVTSDGIFGPGTEMAVRSFQRSNGLTADGIVGPASWAALG